MFALNPKYYSEASYSTDRWRDRSGHGSTRAVRRRAHRAERRAERQLLLDEVNPKLHRWEDPEYLARLDADDLYSDCTCGMCHWPVGHVATATAVDSTDPVTWQGRGFSGEDADGVTWHRVSERRTTVHRKRDMWGHDLGTGPSWTARTPKLGSGFEYTEVY